MKVSVERLYMYYLLKLVTSLCVRTGRIMISSPSKGCQFILDSRNNGLYCSLS